jgi:hypothetical protein
LTTDEVGHNVSECSLKHWAAPRDTGRLHEALVGAGWAVTGLTGGDGGRRGCRWGPGRGDAARGGPVDRAGDVNRVAALSALAQGGTAAVGFGTALALGAAYAVAGLVAGAVTVTRRDVTD